MGHFRRGRVHVALHLPKGRFFCQLPHQFRKADVFFRIQRTVALVEQHGQGFFRRNDFYPVFPAPGQNADALQGQCYIGIQTVLAAPGTAAGKDQRKC